MKDNDILEERLFSLTDVCDFFSKGIPMHYTTLFFSSDLFYRLFNAADASIHDVEKKLNKYHSNTKQSECKYDVPLINKDRRKKNIRRRERRSRKRRRSRKKQNKTQTPKLSINIYLSSFPFPILLIYRTIVFVFFIFMT